MAINQEIISTSWEGQQKSYIEAGLKTLLQRMLEVLESPLAANSVGSNQLTQELRDVINSIGSKVPNTRTVNGKELSRNITLSQSDIPGLVAALAAKVGYSDDEWLQVKAGAMQAATAVQNTTTVNGKRLNNNIVIGMADIPGLETAIGEAGKVKTVSVNNGTPAQPDSNGNVNIQVQTGSTISPADTAPQMDGTANVGSSAKYAREDHVHPKDTSKLSKSDVSVETQGDGTVDINVKDDTYTINLNHTHENMAKLIVCEESDLPSTLDNSAIYVITDSGETEIEKLIIRGMEFAGGGVPDTGEPMISSPSNGSTINLGTNEGSGVSKTITIKGKNLTGDLTVAVGTGLTISYGQALDASRVTIPMAQALLGAQVTIAYSGTGALDDGSLVIRQGNDVLSSVVVVVVVEPVALTAIKLTGTQWLQTDYYPNADTEFEMELKLSENGYTNSVKSVGNGFFLLRASNEAGSNRFDLNHGNGSNADLWKLVMHIDGNIAETGNYTLNNHTLFTADHTIIKLVKTSSTQATFYFAGTATTAMPLKSGTAALPLAIGYNYQFENNGPIYKAFDLTIYRLTITENGSTVRNYVPVTYQGVPGLYDEVNDRFISSKTESELVAVE